MRRMGRCEPHAIHKQLRTHYVNVIARYQVPLHSDTSYSACCVVSMKCEPRLDTYTFYRCKHLDILPCIKMGFIGGYDQWRQPYEVKFPFYIFLDVAVICSPFCISCDPGYLDQ
jgi:hypothetical protein